MNAYLTNWATEGTKVLLVVDMFDMVSTEVYTEAWSTESDEAHCPVLDRTGAGRLWAALGLVLGRHDE